jgi:hypothetical protein
MRAWPYRTLPLSMIALLAAACGSFSERARPAHAEAPQLHSLNENEAIALIDELLREAHWQPVPDWTVAVPPRAELEVDVRLGDSGFGIEWVSEEDRGRYGELLPYPDPAGQLRLLSGAEADPNERVLILVLDHETYRFVPHPSFGDDALDHQDVEQQLRRDLTDFIEYARSQ